MRFLAPLIVIIALLVSATRSPAVEPSSLWRVTPSIVYIDSGAENMCTGFVVAPSRVLTAEHCLPKAGELLADDKPARVIKKSDSLALLEVETSKPPVTFGNVPEQGAEVISLGFAYDGPLAVLVRHIAVINETDIVVDGPIAPGMSGGPMIDGQGRVVGINQMTGAIFGLACGSGEIKAFLK